MNEILFNMFEALSTNKFIIYSIYFIFVVTNLLIIIGFYKIFEKAKVKGWKVLIPFYNIFNLYKIFWKVKYFYILLTISLICIIPTYLFYSQELFELLMFILTIAILYHQIILSIRISRSFKKNIYWSLGIIYFPYIFLMILGFNKSKYIKFKE